MRRRRYARWVGIGKLDTLTLVNVARKHGMLCICGFKPGMCFWNEIGLYGTPAQLHLTEEEWRAAGHAVKNRKPPGAFGFDLFIPPREWADAIGGAP